MQPILEAAAALEQSPFGLWARSSAYAYPYANLVHLLGLVMLVGGIGLLDMRIAGLFRSLPIAALSRVLTPFALAGLVLMAASGLVMFAADAGPLVKSATFRWKVALIGVALVNAAVFRVMWRRRSAASTTEPPVAARVMAVGSLLLWLWIGALGRLIAYA